MNATVTGLRYAKKLLHEILLLEQATGKKGKSMSISQLLILIELRLLAKGKDKEVLLKEIYQPLEMPDFKASRMALGLTKKGRTLREGRKDEFKVKGWDLVTMSEYPDNRRWMTIKLNANGQRLLDKLENL